MNCTDFEKIVIDLARSDAGGNAASDALKHAENCVACATRLAEERMLTLRLRQVSQSLAAAVIPSRVDAAVHSAFEQHRAELKVAAGHSVVRLRTRWTAAAVAAAVLAWLLVWLNGMPGTDRPDSSAKVLMPGIETAGEPSVVAMPEPPEKAETPLSRSVAVEPVENTPAKEPDFLDARSNEPGIPDTAIVSDFIAIPLGSGPMFRESGPIMRVEVSGAVLQSLGFPVSGDMYGSRVRAELLLGEGGLARAIRFVH